MDILERRTSYQPIDQETREIRILTILPGDNDAPLKCTLENVPLFEAYAYEALSYTWGDLNLTTEIFVNNCSFPVTLNLAAALRELRTKGRSRLWIDAVCIDQSNKEEKGLQILRMKAIYQKASNTIVWLGGQQNNSDIAFKALEGISENASVTHGRWLEDVRTARSPTRKAIYQLFERPYWRRVWIIQEIAVSTNVQLYCGNASMEWEAFEAAVLTCSHLAETDTDVDHWSDFHLSKTVFENLRRFRVALTENTALHLLAALKYSSEALATDPRDKVFALLGVTFDGSTFVSDPNYKQPPRQIFIDMAISRILHTRSLDIICLKAFHPSDKWNLPSWTPDWLDLGFKFPVRLINYLSGSPPERMVPSKAGIFKGRSEIGFRASGNSAVQFSIRGSLLKTQGIIFDIVDGLSSAFNLDGGVEDHPAYNAISQSTTLSRDLYGSKEWTVRCLFEAMANVPYQGFDSYESYKRSFAMLMTSWMRKRISLYPNFRPQSYFDKLYGWLEHNKDLLINGQPLQEYLGSSRRQMPNFMAGVQKRAEKALSVVGLPSEIRLAEVVKSVVESGVRIMTTERGFVGRAHPGTRKGDQLALLAGCSFPVILRPSQSVAGQSQLIGDANVEELMYGKEWEEAQAQMQEIVLM